MNLPWIDRFLLKMATIPAGFFRFLLIVIGTVLGVLIAWPVMNAVQFWMEVLERRRASRSIR